jgi:hypothetical protein
MNVKKAVKALVVFALFVVFAYLTGYVIGQGIAYFN